MKYLIPIISILLFNGCATTNYTAPESNNDYPLSITVDASFDETWTHIVDHASSSFFGIDTFEKESGLMTLDFGSSNISEFVKCGAYEAKSIGVNFEGDYADFLVKHRGGRLDGKINITARERDSNQTEVRVNARYVLQTSPESIYSESYEWVFDSNGSDYVTVYNTGNKEDRTCVPTGKAESFILDAVSELSN